MRNPSFNFNQFSNFRAVFSPRKPRNPLVKIGLGLLGLVVLSLLLVVGLVVGVVAANAIDATHREAATTTHRNARNGRGRDQVGHGDWAGKNGR
jgi:uncharacterized membrane protein YjgN (DUF898 family)